jgi:DNA helicase-2/ATP-dependent DNA helicase PcrA
MTGKGSVPHKEDEDVATLDALKSYLDPVTPKSFFLYAGAGSGKTRSLVDALKAFKASSGARFMLERRRVAVITYTNAAADVITQRLASDPLFNVSTIHSFCWSLIGKFQRDIRDYLKVSIPAEIAKLEDEQQRGRAGNASQVRARKLVAKQNRLADLDKVKAFTYNPNGDNFGQTSLSHSEVLQITSDFLSHKPLMQTLLSNAYPFLLIDESQDTNRSLIEAFFRVQEAQSSKFGLGLFGDTMQRIYLDGKADLGKSLPPNWHSPAKTTNHRSATRIVRLGNKIREPIDKQAQRARPDAQEGTVHLYVLSNTTPSKPDLELDIAIRMADLTGDELWKEPGKAVKQLMLEHHMAAERMGFITMWDALDGSASLKSGLRKGELPGVRLFSERVLPILSALDRSDDFAVASVVKAHSPLLHVGKSRGKEEHVGRLQKVRDAVAELNALYHFELDLKFIDVLRCVSQTGLFEIPASLLPFVASDIALEADEAEAEFEEADGDSPGIRSDLAWSKFLQSSFSQIIPYVEYVNDRARYGTHHGVKGQEFARVMVIMDDSTRRGRSGASYEKLFGVKEKSTSDLKNEREGRETNIDLTRRLFYVTCTRAEKSLALVAYTEKPGLLKDRVVQLGLFDPHEVSVL